MITDKRIEEYIDSISRQNSDFLKNLREYARENEIPILKTNTEAFLRTLIRISEPSEILEIGTAIGYSAIVMAEECKEKALITTIEKYKKRVPVAADNIQKSGFEKQIKLIEGDAAEVLNKLKQESKVFDFIFLDAAKAQYIRWLPLITAMMRKGSILFADNVLQNGNIVQSRYAIERRDRCIHSRMREFLYSIMHDIRLKSSILPLGDGVALSVYIGNENEEKN